MRWFAAVISVSILTACTSMMGDGKVESYKSDFDGSTKVEMQPGYVFDIGESSAPFSLGGRWTSDSPSKAWIIVEITSFSTGGTATIKSEEGLQLNLDGEIVKISSEQKLTDIETSGGQFDSNTSYKGFKVDLSLINEIVEADSAKVKVITSRGYKEAEIREGMGSALEGLERFLKEVEDVR